MGAACRETRCEAADRPMRGDWSDTEAFRAGCRASGWPRVRRGSWAAGRRWVAGEPPLVASRLPLPCPSASRCRLTPRTRTRVPQGGDTAQWQLGESANHGRHGGANSPKTDDRGPPPVCRLGQLSPRCRVSDRGCRGALDTPPPRPPDTADLDVHNNVTSYMPAATDTAKPMQKADPPRAPGLLGVTPSAPAERRGAKTRRPRQGAVPRRGEAHD